MEKVELFYNLRYKLNDLYPFKKKGTTLREVAIDLAAKEAKAKYGLEVDRSKILAAPVDEENGVTTFEAEGISFRFELVD